MMRHFLLPLILSSMLAVTACSKSGTVSPKPSTSASGIAASVDATKYVPIEQAGINLRMATRQAIEAAFLKTHNMTFVPRNDWESVADNAGSAVSGAEKLELGTTKAGAFVFLQYIFTGSDFKQRTRVQQLVEAKYGKPIGVTGHADRGEYRAVWDMGGGFLIQVSSGGTEKPTFLIFVSSENLLKMKSEHQESVNVRARQKLSGQ